MARIRIVVCLALCVGGVAAGDAGWSKSPGNPVLGGKLGACGDACVLQEKDTFRMWFSWRPKKSIALVESKDGIRWDEPQIVLGPNEDTDWEANVSRPAVYKRPYHYHLWYTGQAQGRSWIGQALSPEGKTWTRERAAPALSADMAWEKTAVTYPRVQWEPTGTVFRMWYSGGEQAAPDAIGYATSAEGNMWTKHEDNPVFTADPNLPWEKHGVRAGQVLRRGGWHFMFYVGCSDAGHPQIGLARSGDGIRGWQRHPANPIISPTTNGWDHDGCYEPFAVFDETANRWLLWYNGRKGDVEQIGLATRHGEDLGFPDK